jgi:hypothetical protein
MPKFNDVLQAVRSAYADNTLRELAVKAYNADQPRDDHGRFGSGSGGSSSGDGKPLGGADVLSHVEDLRNPDGGFTLDPRTGESPKGTGDGKGNGPYAVALGGAHAAEPIQSSPSLFEKDANGRSQMGRQLADFIKQHAKELSKPGRYIGGWHDPKSGKIYLDISEVFPRGSKDAAASAAADRNQIAMMDLSTFESIDTGGTGEQSTGK